MPISSLPAKTCLSLNCPSRKCVQLPSGPKCHCGKGYTLNESATSCEDVDECKIYGTCSQKCRNLPGSFQCECQKDFRLSSDNSSCLTSTNESSWMYFSTENGIFKYNIESNYDIKIDDSLQEVLAIAADANYVYWSTIEPQKQGIYRRNHSTSTSELIALNGVGGPEGLAVDWWTENIYYTDSIFNHIAVCGHFQTRCMALITRGLYKPRGIALHPPSARLFWSDWGRRPHIGMSYMDGTGQETFLEERVHWPNGLSIDYPSDRLYWVDAKTGTLETITLDGKERHTIQKLEDWHAFNVEVLGDQLYWTEKFHYTLNAVNKFTGKDRKNLLMKPKLRSLYGFHPVIHRPLSEADNPCHQHHCSELCLLAKDGKFTCACSDEGSIGGAVCHEIPDKILIGYHNSLFEYSYVEVGVPKIVPLRRAHYLKRNNVDRLAFSMPLNEIFIADNHKQEILRMKLTSFTKATVLVEHSIGRVTSMVVDSRANNLYWTDSERRTVEMISLSTQRRVTVRSFGSDFEPFSMVLAPATGKIFVAGNRNSVKVYQMSMSGAGLSHYLRKWRGASGKKGEVTLTIDEESSVIYAALGDKIIGWNFELNTEKRHRYNLRLDINQLEWIPGIRRFFWTAGDGQIYWDSPSAAVDKSMRIPVDKDGAAPPETIPIVRVFSGALKLYHPCTENNGGCSDICVALGPTYTCLCGIGRMFKSGENKTCITQDDCEFKCGDGVCLTMGRYCNGKRDCVDGSDEEHCYAHDLSGNHHSCSYDEFKCFDGSACLEIAQKCDHHFDCKDQSDEWHCENFNMTTRCHNHQFLCNTTMRCVDMISLCDEYDDCLDGSDEMVCELPKSERPSCGDLYDCGNGQCIDKEWICDGETDCLNEDDELKCDNRDKYCPVNYFECGDNSCVHMAMVCDGHPDCPDQLDEFGCPQNHAPKPDKCEYQCASNRSICLPQEKVCNKYPDCPRGEDEMNCPLCAPHQFQCKSLNVSTSNIQYVTKYCLDPVFRCDKEKDCEDGSDEEGCDHEPLQMTAHVLCNADSFHCNSGECIDMALVCDKFPHCYDGSDENGECDKDCKKDYCEQGCIHLPTGPKCLCVEGFELDAEGRTCSDINECLENPCTQRCENSHGSFECSCFPNFMLHLNKRYCKAMGATRTVMYSSGTQVRKIRAFPFIREVFWATPRTKDIYGMAVDIPRNLLYVSSMEESAIYQIDLQAKTFKAVQTDRPVKLAVEWSSGNLYLVDNSGVDGGQIRACNFESKRCITIVSLRKDNFIEHVEVDAREQLLFFTQETNYRDGERSTKALLSMRLDGTKMTYVRRFMPHMIFTVDVNKRMIYFADPKAGKIMEINYEGHQERQVASGLEDIMSAGITSLGTFQGYIMVAMVGKPFYLSCVLTRPQKNCYTSHLDVTNMGHFLIVQETIQPKLEDVCNNHRCSRVCIPTVRGPKCVCNGGLQVPPGEKCPDLEEDSKNDLVAIEDNEVHSAMSATDLEPSVAGRIILIVLFVLCGIAGLTLFVYRRKYLMSTFTIT